MNPALITALQFLIVAFNVQVTEGAPVQKSGYMSLNVPCGNTERMAATLKGTYGEKVFFKGISNLGIMRFYGNDRTRTFSVSLETSGMTCLITAGNFLIKETEGREL